MGSRTADKLKEIEDLRASLGGKLSEIERRLPLAGYGKKIAAAVAGSSVAGSALGFGLRRMRGKRRKAKRKDQAPVAPAVVNVSMLPKGAAYIAALGLAGWAGYKIYDALQRRSGGGSASERPYGRPAVVTPMPEPGRQTGN